MLKKRLLTLFVFLPICAMFGTTTYGQNRTPSSALTVHDYVVPKDTMLQFSLSPLPENGNGRMCRDLRIVLRFYGTHGDKLSHGRAFPADDFPRAKELLLLDEVSLHIARDKVQEVAVKQPFAGSQTVIVEAQLPARFKGCLESSAANIVRPDGAVIAIVPPRPPLRRQATRKAIIGGGAGTDPMCFPCAPVCACGTAGDGE